MEGRLLQWRRWFVEQGGVIDFDLKTAFPSVARIFVRLMMNAMKVPKQARRMVGELYKGLWADLVVMGGGPAWLRHAQRHQARLRSLRHALRPLV